jgi:hypothetical protein
MWAHGRDRATLCEDRRDGETEWRKRWPETIPHKSKAARFSKDECCSLYHHCKVMCSASPFSQLAGLQAQSL